MFFMRQTHGCPIKGLIIRVFGDPYGFYTFFVLNLEIKCNLIHVKMHKKCIIGVKDGLCPVFFVFLIASFDIFYFVPIHFFHHLPSSFTTKPLSALNKFFFTNHILIGRKRYFLTEIFPHFEMHSNDYFSEKYSHWQHMVAIKSFKTYLLQI